MTRRGKAGEMIHDLHTGRLYIADGDADMTTPLTLTETVDAIKALADRTEPDIFKQALDIASGRRQTGRDLYDIIVDYVRDSDTELYEDVHNISAALGFVAANAVRPDRVPQMLDRLEGGVRVAFLKAVKTFIKDKRAVRAATRLSQESD